MPVSFLTAEQERRYGRYAGEPTSDQLARHFHLDDADRDLAGTKRSDPMRLGYAVQLGTVRFLGTFLEDPTDVPPGVSGELARQLGVADPRCLTEYREGRAKWQHAREIRARFGYREFTDGVVRFRLARWLYALCWTGTDRPSVLFDRATVWLVTEKVLLPGASALERLVARIRARAAQRLWRALARDITPAQRERLDALLLSDNGRPSPLDRLRDGPYLRSGAELSRAVERLDEVRLLTAGLPGISHVPPGRVTALARFATVAKAQAVARMPAERRMATLLAFIRTLEATAQDDVLDLLDIVVTKLFSDAAAVGKKTRLRTIRDLDAAALKLRRAGAVLMDETVDDAAVRAAAFALVPRADFAHAMEQIDLLIRPPGDLYFTELRAQNNKLRFMPALLRAVTFGAAPAGQPILDAVLHLRANEKRGPSAAAPLAFVSSGWKRQLRSPDGSIDKVAYRLCLLEAMRLAIRRRDLFAAPSLRYADPRLGLLSGAAWEAARPAICRTLGLSTDAPAEISRLSERLDSAYRTTAVNLPGNAAVTIDGDDLVLTALERIDDPPSFVALKAAVAARLPRVDLPELLLEMHARTGFADGFTHASEGGARADDVATSVCAVLLAEACNTGFEPLIRLDRPSLRRSRLSWVRQNYIRAETLTRANAALVASQNRVPLARSWGGGDVASADGLRFVVPIRTIHSGPNPHYFGQERGVTFYNLVSDQFTGLNGITVPGTLRDSLVLLSVVLEQQTELQPTEIMTDTGAYTDIMFGIFHLLGFQFSPRLADIGGSRFWRVNGKADYGALNALASQRINTALIAEHWEDLLRLAGSLKLGTVLASGLIRTLQTKDRPTRLARALEELGRLVKTLYLLRYIDDEAYRRRILVQLNRGEGRHQLARTVFHGKRGELRQRYREGQEDQLGALGLVVNVIVLWNTIYMDAALDQVRAEGFNVRDEDVARLSPLGFDHINMLGRYAFVLPDTVARGELRPLRNPSLANDDDG
ncbi:MAG TPA: Tn3 family transposase [Steroidobacteraceae bacterium]|nr:Tn3 family transposase [Steroidobacteraceae bacterium]